ncbi:hypothetical protein HQ865_23895 [Mucilaginibacter mali]|uniref:Uncharacterized protein n=1 Tax=Mucilaginibacter mali TaxID=2740462 RepID=A0A7D4QIA1_9SPHI|nr:hypothetical protein [Mucilaginibacter mali]QKJ32672.1 hypothetical protein HQ865_23895 [Mucilaginibacter mali]
MDLRIRNIDDLHSEIARLKGVEQEQRTAIGLRFTGPANIFATFMSLFPKSAATEGLKSSGVLGQDFVGLLSRVLLPVALNKTIFRNSNFLVKTLVGLASQKASHFISEDSVMSVWDKAKSLFSKFGKKDKPKANPENLKGFGVPAE